MVGGEGSEGERRGRLEVQELGSRSTRKSWGVGVREGNEVRDKQGTEGRGMQRREHERGEARREGGMEGGRGGAR